MDIEDAYKLKILSFEETRNLFLSFFDEKTKNYIDQRIKDENITDNNEKVIFMRACVIGALENNDFLKNVDDGTGTAIERFYVPFSFEENEENILNGTFNGSLIEHIDETKATAYKRCADMSIKNIYNSKPVLDVELSGFKIMETLMKVMIDAAINPNKFFSKQLLNRVSNQYEIDAPDLETRIMAVIDYISGMTDVYALDIYQKINGISLPII